MILTLLVCSSHSVGFLGRRIGKKGRPRRRHAHGDGLSNAYPATVCDALKRVGGAGSLFWVALGITAGYMDGPVG